jgi:hypothetical protein
MGCNADGACERLADAGAPRWAPSPQEPTGVPRESRRVPVAPVMSRPVPGFIVLTRSGVVDQLWHSVEIRLPELRFPAVAGYGMARSIAAVMLRRARWMTVGSSNSTE